ncbi:hypothetical protein I8752_34340 [Nostocaceae cyanobacterium CENA369]|uniref:Uncharacterized protein n=1 Tax=Dendronalium phyllosphericum CENA369 TaxID=1725256 RepID=A0A8J7LKN6_9NOST|nr:hypothetical protein [Dendronalium phyllosphericum]MBH8577954.1 hypothetical protein [Dendronalium phyllosphericum CENA369]
MVLKNGQTQEASRRLDSGDIFDKSERLGGVQTPSRSNGTEQVRPNQVNCSTENTFRRTSKHGGGSAGKIAERLKRIEDKHISYLKAHQLLLKSQLDYSQEEEENFRKEVQELEEEIYNLISSEDKSQSITQENEQ